MGAPTRQPRDAVPSGLTAWDLAHDRRRIDMERAAVHRICRRPVQDDDHVRRLAPWFRRSIGPEPPADRLSDFSAVSSGATVQASFADADLGYAVAAGILRRTTDGGTHWTVVGTPWMDVLPSPSPTPISMPTDVQLSAPSTNVVWALVAGHS